MEGVMKNKIVVITGAASGQGKAEAILFAKLGCKVVICDINLQPLKEDITLDKWKSLTKV